MVVLGRASEEERLVWRRVGKFWCCCEVLEEADEMRDLKGEGLLLCPPPCCVLLFVVVALLFVVVALLLFVPALEMRGS